MAQIRTTDEIIELLQSIKKQHAKRTGEFVTYNRIIEAALDDFEDEMLDEDADFYEE